MNSPGFWRLLFGADEWALPAWPWLARASQGLDRLWQTAIRRGGMLQGLLLLIPLLLPAIWVFSDYFAPTDSAYYHMTIARSYAEGEYLYSGLPWLPLTDMGQGPFRQGYLLLHMVLAPVHWLFEGEMAFKVASYLLGLSFIASVFVVLRLWGVIGSFWWGIAAWLASPLLASAIVQIEDSALLLVLLVWLLDALVRARPVQLFICCALAAWASPVAPLLVLPGVCFSLAALVGGRTLVWWPLLGSIAGIVVGSILHPYFPGNIYYRIYELSWLFGDIYTADWPAVFNAGWVRLPTVSWQGLLAGGTALLLPAALAVALAPAVRGQKLDTAVAVRTLAAAMLLVLLGVLALSVGDVTIWLLLVSALLLAPLLLHQLSGGRSWVGLLGAVWLMYCASGTFIERAASLEQPAGTSVFQARQKLAEQMSEAAPAGTVVVVPWRSFPWLVWFNPSHRYVAGLDPALMDLDGRAFQTLYYLYEGNLTDPDAAMQQLLAGARLLVVPTASAVLRQRLAARSEFFEQIELEEPSWLLFRRRTDESSQ